jgi:translation initiation factor 2B subunit (eIF-2B alpha/beta/delta family)
MLTEFFKTDEGKKLISIMFTDDDREIVEKAMFTKDFVKELRKKYYDAKSDEKYIEKVIDSDRRGELDTYLKEHEESLKCEQQRLFDEFGKELSVDEIKNLIELKEKDVLKLKDKKHKINQNLKEIGERSEKAVTEFHRIVNARRKEV